MPRFRVPFLLFAIGMITLAQTPIERASIFELADVISIPRYPRMAVATGQSGLVQAVVRVLPNGACQVVSVGEGPRFLREGVQKALKSWSFLQGKAPTQISVSFEFVLLPTSATEEEVKSEVFPELNRVLIKSRKPTLLTMTDPPQIH